MKKLEELLIEHFTLLIGIFSVSWICLVIYGFSMS